MPTVELNYVNSGIITMTFIGNSVNMTYARHDSPSTSVVRTSDWWMEGHGVQFPSGTQSFLCPMLMTC